MVSPFMSFATGALGAVNTQINKYQQTEAAEALAEREQEKLFERAEFDRATKIEVANITGKNAAEAARIRANATDKNNFTNVAGFKIPKGETAPERISSIFATLASDPDKFKRAMEDANQAPALKRLVLSTVTNAYGLTQNLSPNNREGNAPRSRPIVSELYSKTLAGNPALLSMIKEMESGNVVLPKAPTQDGTSTSLKTPALSAQARVNGENISVPKTPEVTLAGGIYGSNRLSVLGKPKEAVIADLTRRIGGAFDPNQGKYEGNNKYWSAASSPFVKYIASKNRSDVSETEAAKDFLYNIDHGFIDEKGRLNGDAYKLIDIYAEQARAHDKQPGYALQSKKLSDIMKTNPTIKKEIDELNGSLPLARQAGVTLEKLKQQVNVANTGSRFNIGLLSGIVAAPELVSDAVRIVNQAIGDSRLDKSAKNRFKSSIKALDEAKKSGNAEGIAASQVGMLENMLAYQLTSILQGGTGGRTISDTDVTRALNMMGGKYDSKAQKLQKLEFIGELINNATDKGQLYSLLTGNDNAGKYYAVKKVTGLMAEYNMENFDQKINDKYKAEVGESPDTVRSSNINDLVKSASRIPAAEGNYDSEKYKIGIGMVLNDGEGKTSPGQIVGKQYVVNAYALDLQKNALRAYPDVNNQEHVKKRAEINARAIAMAPGVFDIVSGEYKPFTIVIKKNDEGREVVQLEDGSPDLATIPRVMSVRAVSPDAKTPLPSSRTTSTVGRPLSERRAKPRVRLPEEVAASQQELATDAKRAETSREAARERARRSGSRLFGGGNR